MHLLIRDRDDLRRFLDATRIGATLCSPSTAEPLTEDERAKQVLDVLRESGAL